jgi:hypothetical protein
MQLVRGEIDLPQFVQSAESHARRPVDEQMFQVFFTFFERKLERYQQFFQAVTRLYHQSRRGPVSISDEQAIDRAAARLGGRMDLHREEALTVFEFMEKARAVRGLDLAESNGWAFCSASEMILAILKYAKESWKSSRNISERSRNTGEFTHAASAIELFQKTLLNELPPPHRLNSFLQQERTLAALYVGELSSVPISPPTEDESEIKKEHRLTITDWSDLAIGIDGSRSYWLLTPAPPLGGRFEISKAKQLKTRSRQWTLVLANLANSQTQSRLNCRRLNEVLFRVHPPSNAMKWEEVETEHLNRQQSGPKKGLRQCAKDLKKLLLRHVSVPEGLDPPFSVERDEFVCHFSVAYLDKDGSDHIRFGNEFMTA